MQFYNFAATVVNIVDGDTIDCDNIDLGFNVRLGKTRFRLLGIDTPERKEPGFHAAKDYLSSRLLNKRVYLHTEKPDVFGRWLAVVVVDGVDINAEMIEKGFAKLYG